MFTVVLMETNQSNPVEKVYSAGNDFLSKEDSEDSSSYPLLSEISLVDICVFSSARMPELIKELSCLKLTVNTEQQKHLSDIIELAKRCADMPDYILGFTPFATFLNDKEIGEVLKA